MYLNIKRLEKLREGYDENVRVFAERINISHAAYYFFINGERVPTLDTITKIGNALGIDPKTLIV